MKTGKFNFYAGSKTTAMGIMPHSSVERALDLALSLDIPFWPQLPNVNFYEDMYVQISQNFPGIIADPENEKISFDTERFVQELVNYSQQMEDPETFTLDQKYSLVYHEFLSKRLKDYPAIRGQATGPVSFGFRVTDENSRPIIYNDDVRSILFDFVQRKVNVQYQQLRKKNHNAFVWLDEPGLGWVFSGLSGYNDVQAKQDYHSFLTGIDGPKALHLCANVNLPYLLGLEIEILSFDAYQIELMPKGYVSAVVDFLRNGGIISWGIIPTDAKSLGKETPETLANLLTSYWEVISQNSNLAPKEIGKQALIAPARCCLKNIEQADTVSNTTGNTAQSSNLTIEEQLVERAFSYLKTLSKILKNRFNL